MMSETFNGEAPDGQPATIQAPDGRMLTIVEFPVSAQKRAGAQAPPSQEHPIYEAFMLCTDEGKRVGDYSVQWGGTHPNGYGMFWIDTVWVDDELQGHWGPDNKRIPGIGRALYRHIAIRTPPPKEVPAGVPYHLVARRGAPNDTAQGLWDSLIRSGDVEYLEDDRLYRFVSPNEHTLHPQAGMPE